MRIPLLDRLLTRPATSEEPPALEEELRLSSERFTGWLQQRAPEKAPLEPLALIDPALEALRAATPRDAPPPQDALSDAAAFLGESFRAQHGGVWNEHPLFGLVVSQDKNAALHFLPLQAVEKKWELGAGLSLARFFENLGERIDAERNAAERGARRTLEAIGADLAATQDGREQAVAGERARRFTKTWKARFEADLPFSLQGVREAERFLRSQFFLFGIGEESLVDAGFFVGEVGRGLFGGKWDFAEVRESADAARAALVWPELPYYPVGRVLRLMTEQPEGESLDEYLRLVPSARQELRKTQTPATTEAPRDDNG